MDYAEDPQHPHEDLIDPLAGGLKLEFPEGRLPPPQLPNNAPPRGFTDAVLAHWFDLWRSSTYSSSLHPESHACHVRVCVESVYSATKPVVLDKGLSTADNGQRATDHGH